MLHVVLCAYNEEKAIGSLMESFERLQAAVPLNIVLVNDASSDKTESAVKNYENRLPLKIISQPVNRGLGSSLRKALNFQAPLMKDDDQVVSLDADATHPPEFIPSLIETLKRRQADVVIASRFCGPNSGERGMPFVRSLIAKFARLLFSRRFAAIRGIRDTTSGFRCYRAKALKNLLQAQGKSALKAGGFAIQLEILLKLTRLGAMVVEIPFFLDYRRKRSASGFRYFSAMREYLPLFIKGADWGPS
ncbi:MAG: glycosyltransferase family 2 protein [Elusimicrobia bacterium]|nr:glycosyltransferase family 2 protein [Elusimicrobiota bacterium]